MAEIDHEFTDEIVCPYCGAKNEPYAVEDSAVFTEERTRLECNDCEKEFVSYCHTTYSFTTYTVDKAAEAHKKAEWWRQHQERTKARKAEAAKWLPGTIVRVKDDAPYASHICGREGVVPNKELDNHGFVNVTLNATHRHKGYESFFEPEHLVRVLG